MLRPARAARKDGSVYHVDSEPARSARASATSAAPRWSSATDDKPETVRGPAEGVRRGRPPPEGLLRRRGLLSAVDGVGRPTPSTPRSSAGARKPCGQGSSGDGAWSSRARRDCPDARRRAHRCEILDALEAAVAPGVTTWELDSSPSGSSTRRARKPRLQGLPGFPCRALRSINHEVVHGIPSRKRALREGDLMKLDFGVVYRASSATRRAPCRWARSRDEAQRLLDATRESLEAGIAAMTPATGSATSATRCSRTSRPGLLAWCATSWATASAGKLHEAPQVPNYGDAGALESAAAGHGAGGRAHGERGDPRWTSSRTTGRR